MHFLGDLRARSIPTHRPSTEKGLNRKETPRVFPQFDPFLPNGRFARQDLAVFLADPSLRAELDGRAGGESRAA